MSGETFLTFIASDWATPIADIALAWHRSLDAKPNIDHLTRDDDGRAYAICMLLAVMLESMTLRAGYDLKEEVGQKSWVKKWWRRQESHSEREQVVDLFVLRDALAHNHVYHFVFDEGDQPVIGELMFGWDRVLKQRVDPKTRQLRASGLNVRPQSIGPSDVGLAAGITRRAARYLQQRGASVGPTELGFARREGFKDFWALLDAVVEKAHRQRVSST